MLKAVVDDLNQVDEAVRSFYVEKDGKFFLNVTPTDGYELDNVANLKTALGAERKARGDLETQLKEFEGLDPKKAKAAINKAAELAKFDPEKEADRIAEEKFKAREEQLKAKSKEAEDALKLTLERRESQVKKLLVENEIKAGLGKLNPLDDARDAIELLAAQAVRTKEVNGEFVVEVVDNNGNPRIKDVQGNPMGIADYLSELREKRPALFKAEQKSGVGIQPNTGTPGSTTSKNPWMKDSFNITEQMTLMNTNPSLANQLKQAAGVK